MEKVMKLFDFVLILITTLCLTTNQVFLKLWLERHGTHIFPFQCINTTLFFKYELLVSVFAFFLAVSIWLFLLQRSDFSLIYPLISLTYVFGLLAAKYVLNENIPTSRWIGVFIIMIGVFMVAQSNKT